MPKNYNNTQTDYYRKMTSELFDVPYEEVTKEQRAKAKNRFMLLPYCSINSNPYTHIELTEQEKKEIEDIKFKFLKD